MISTTLIPKKNFFRDFFGINPISYTTRWKFFTNSLLYLFFPIIFISALSIVTMLFFPYSKIDITSYVFFWLGLYCLARLIQLIQLRFAFIFPQYSFKSKFITCFKIIFFIFATLSLMPKIGFIPENFKTFMYYGYWFFQIIIWIFIIIGTVVKSKDENIIARNIKEYRTRLQYLGAIGMNIIIWLWLLWLVILLATFILFFSNENIKSSVECLILWPFIIFIASCLERLRETLILWGKITVGFQSLFVLHSLYITKARYETVFWKSNFLRYFFLILIITWWFISISYFLYFLTHPNTNYNSDDLFEMILLINFAELCILWILFLIGLIFSIKKEQVTEIHPKNLENSQQNII